MSIAAHELDRSLTCLTCPGCARRNPAEALYCYHDGIRLSGHAAAEDPSAHAHRFPQPFVFSSGRTCQSFEEFALACQDQWETARDLLRDGTFERFLGGSGRVDLAMAARTAAAFPDPDRGLDQFLDALPVEVLNKPQLRIDPPDVDLGTLHPGEDRQFDLRLGNTGQRLLWGTIRCDCPWLALGSAAGGKQKLFACPNEVVIPVFVRGGNLRAKDQPLAAEIEVESNGGTARVGVRVEVPVKPFPPGLLGGARSPRQMAEKIRAKPREAAAFLEDGSVARWYRDNGWTYPIQVPTSTGLGAVQQFFEALGLSRPPRVAVHPEEIALQGGSGARLQQSLRVSTQEKRPVYAHALSDQPWLTVGTPRTEGATVTVPLTVPAVPDQPGATLHARVKVVSNGNQRFEVPVTLTVDASAPVSPPSSASTSFTPSAPLTPAPSPLGGEGRRDAPQPYLVTPLPPAPPAVSPATEPPTATRRWLVFLPAVLLVLALLGIAARDALRRSLQEDSDAASNQPLIAFRFHEGKVGDPLDAQLPEATMRFGLRMLGGGTGPDGTPRRLTADEYGRTNNLCVRIDGSERLFGSAPGRWAERSVPIAARTRAGVEGMQSTWAWDDKKVQVSQYVELVRGEESNLLDTCLVRYVAENRDQAPHQVGLRFLLDTFIGANDGVPFTIPGQAELCTDSKDFRKDVPAFLQALEREDLAHPGTVAHLKLRLGDREPPGRVTLGAWPDDNLQLLLGNVPQARGVNTLWDVPVRSMKTLFPYDSAVVLYWDDKPLPPEGKREVGCAYGLGSVAASAKLLLTIDGSFKPGGELTVTALVNNPAEGEKVTLTVPGGFQVVGETSQPVPAPAETGGRNSPVTWKVKAGALGNHVLQVQSSTGATQNKMIRIKERSIFD